MKQIKAVAGATTGTRGAAAAASTTTTATAGRGVSNTTIKATTKGTGMLF